MNTTYSLVLGTVLLDFRENADLTIKHCCDQAELSPTQWVRLEKGDGGFTLPIITKITKVMGIGIGELFTEVDKRVSLLAANNITVLDGGERNTTDIIKCVKKLSRQILIGKTKAQS